MKKTPLIVCDLKKDSSEGYDQSWKSDLQTSPEKKSSNEVKSKSSYDYFIEDSDS